MHAGIDHNEASEFSGQLPDEWRWIRNWSRHPRHVLPGQFWDKLRNRKARLKTI